MRYFLLSILLCGFNWAQAAPGNLNSPYQLNAEQLGLVINKNDPLSLEIGEYYAKQHQLKPEQILSVTLPTDRVWITEGELEQLNAQINAYFGDNTQALALAWAKPYRVNCLGITYGVTMGYVEGVCANLGKPTPESAYFNHPSTQPYTDLKIRPSMLLAAKDFSSAKKLIDTGLQAWGNQPKGTAYYLTTKDQARSSRAPLFPPSQTLSKPALKIENLNAETLRDRKDVIFYQTGLARVDGLETLKFLPGALADHLTSFGGQLTDSSQMSSLRWLEAGASASYGTVSEPYSYPQKFPHPQVLLFHYINGASAVEAYWKSVAWPAQGVFIGDPLAAPYRNLSPFKTK
ncbi:TIGR03790 family protein [Chitinibacter fontanus]|uniref:TIGR03790 family protein n=1 Tax=Chitinibacter fontanus TaxID=1737446 RepID=A0A7D5V8S8_9NEIS|nr:TIGR03790 family protein [Chitinibacter fontanus]QLI80936.1 TIGR03790 family protein [Chitinibacter fontanus]